MKEGINCFAHASRNIAAIDPAMEKINQAWAAASQEIYAATNADGAADPTGGAGPQAGGKASSTAEDNVTDVNFEEVK